MNNFDAYLSQNNLGAMIEEQYGRFGHFSQEAADTIIEVVRLEAKPGKENDLASQLAYTWMNESVFNERPMPNTNGVPNDITKWDIGPGQLNVFWTHAAIKIGDIKAADLNEADYFGNPIPQHPAKFDGDPITNLRMVCRTLLSIRAGRDKLGISESLLETQVTHYTGPNARPFRRENWRKFSEPLKQFFTCYTLGEQELRRADIEGDQSPTFVGGGENG